MYQGTADASQLCPTQRPTYYFICQFNLMRPEFDVHDLDPNYLHGAKNRTRHEITDIRRASASTDEKAPKVHRLRPARLPRWDQTAEPGRTIAQPRRLPPRVRGSPGCVRLGSYRPADARCIYTAVRPIRLYAAGMTAHFVETAIRRLLPDRASKHGVLAGGVQSM